MEAPLSSSTPRRGRAFYKKRSHRAGFNSINITPFVDVMLVLLIVFMVTAPMLKVSVAVQLPKVASHSSTASRAHKDKKNVTITIDEQGMIYVDNQQTTFNQLGDVLSRSYDQKDMTIYLRGDENLAYGKMMRLMHALASLGYKKVALQGEPAATTVKR
jgi:biopolymer transport protein TolR